jgi:hypothetical protein
MTFPLKIFVCSLKSVKRLPSDEYTGRVSTSLWWIRRGVLTPLWWIHRGVEFLVYLEQVSEHVDKKTSWWWKDQGGKTLQCINHRGVLMYFAPAAFIINQFRSTLRFSSPGSQLPLQITPRIFDKNSKSFLCMSNGTKRSCLMKK